MRSRRIRFLITLVVATFLASNVAVAARACVEGLKGQDLDVAQQVSTDAPRHSEVAAGDDTPCLTQCAQGYRNHDQKLAPNVTELVSPPVSIVQYSSIEIKPAVSVIALAPRAFGPSLTILFRNLRN